MMWQMMAAATLAVSQPAPMAPSGKWQVDFGKSACLALRTYGEGADRVTLAFKPAAHQRSMEVILLEPGRRTRATGGEASVAFDGSPVAAKLIRFGDSESKSVITRMTVPMRAEDLTGRTRIAIDADGDKVDLALSSMDDVAELLGGCVSDLRELYNMDRDLAEGPRGGADGAKGDVRTLFKAEDYPSESQRKQASGSARAFLLIDETGKVADCSLASYAGDPLILAQTCAILMQRARFEPASDADCFPTRGHYFTPTITWRISGNKDADQVQAEFDAMDAPFADEVSEGSMAN